MTDENTKTILDRLDGIENEQKELKNTIEVFIKVSDAYQKAADRGAAASERVANLAFTVVGAAAAIAIISPAVKALAEFAISSQ